MASLPKLKQTLSADGTLRIEDGRMFLEIEELGDKALTDLLEPFNGQVIKLSVGATEEIFE